MARLIKVDRNGTKYYEGFIECDRCFGKGTYYIGVNNGHLVPSPVDGGTCFKCGGSGKVAGKWKEYTPEYEAKLEARRQAKAQQRAEEEAKRQAEREAARLKEEAEKQAERERLEAIERAEKAKSQYIGSIGDKLDIKAVYVKSAWFEVQAFRGYGTQTMYIHTFKIGDNVAIWKTTAVLGKWGERGEWQAIEEGAEVQLKGTIKELGEYKGEKQTVLTRCKVK